MKHKKIPALALSALLIPTGAAMADVSYNLNDYDSTGMSGKDGALPPVWTKPVTVKGYKGSLNAMWVANFKSNSETLKLSTEDAVKRTYTLDGKKAPTPSDYWLAVEGKSWNDTASGSGQGNGLDFGLVNLPKRGNLTITVEADGDKKLLVPAISVYKGWDTGVSSSRNASFTDKTNNPLGGTSNLTWIASKASAAAGAAVTLTLINLDPGQYEVFVGGNNGEAGGYKYKMTLAAAPAQYRIVDLGVLNDGAWSVANGVNNSGQASGYSRYNSAISATHAFRYADGSMQDLGALPDGIVSGGTYSRGYNINDEGTVVGYSYYTTKAAHAVVFKTDNTIQDLGTFRPGNDGGGTAHDINNRGFVTGYAGSGTAGSINYMPFLKDLKNESAPLIALGDLGGTRGKALALNDSNQVVGWSFLPNDAASHAFLWEQKTGKMVDLTPELTAEVPTATGTGANDINKAGWIVGSISSPGGTLPYVFKPGKKVTQLGWLPGGSGASASSINDKMQIVGWAKIDDKSGDWHGFLYKNGAIHDLNTLVNTGDWDIENASAISNKGYIVGSGVNSKTGADHALMLVPLTIR